MGAAWGRGARWRRATSRWCPTLARESLQREGGGELGRSTLLPSQDPSARARTSRGRKVHLWELEAKDSLPQPGQVLRGVPVKVRKQPAAPCLGKLSDRPGQVTELLGGHYRGQEAQHAVEQFDDGTWLLRGQAA